MYEVFKQDFKCRIYIDADEDINSLIKNLADVFRLVDVNSNSLSVRNGDILITQNKNFNSMNRKSPEDGFLFYRYIAEIEPNRVLGRENAVDFVSEVLKNIWQKGIPAIADCDYESDLPNKGGYKSLNIPIPV